MEELISQEKIPNLTGVACDSRKVKPGYAFVAISGFKTDGNKFINEAIDNGASIIFTDKKLDTAILSRKSIPIIQVNDARTYLAHLSAEYYNYPSNQINLIGVTGTNGKTTTTHLIYNLLNYHKNKASRQNIAGLIGTVNVDTGKKILPGNLTTPDPITLQKYLRQMVENRLKYACMEVSSHGIKLKRIVGNNFAIKIGTNISADHFDLHPNFNDYLQVKRTFLERKEDALVLLNNDNEFLRSFGQIAKKQYNFSIKSKCDISADDITKWQKGQEFTYNLNRPLINEKKQKINPCRFTVRMKLPGAHNIYNALIAITVALYYNIEQETIQKFFEGFQGIWRRLQFIYDQEFTIIDDCAHNPGSYGAVFSSVLNLEFNNLIIINSLRGNRGQMINKKNAETISKILKDINNYHLITSNCNDVVKPIDKVNKGEEDVFINTLIKNHIKFEHCQSLESALKKALNFVNENDIILLLGPHAMDHAGEMMLKMIYKK
ncbi:MAG: Mur ligase family protein [Halanaerobiales bacterium]